MRDGILRKGMNQSGACHRSNPSTGEVESSITDVVNTYDHADWTVRLIYTITLTQEHLDYPVGLRTTRPNLGGVRWWFTCPLITDGRRCGRRGQKLYLPPGGKYWGCRHCYDLSYESRNQDATGRAIAKAQRICVLLGGSASFQARLPDRLKGMWRRTFERHRTEFKRAQMKTVWLWRWGLGDWVRYDADDLSRRSGRRHASPPYCSVTLTARSARLWRHFAQLALPRLSSASGRARPSAPR